MSSLVSMSYKNKKTKITSLKKKSSFGSNDINKKIKQEENNRSDSLITEKKQKKENMLEVTIETPKGQKNKTAELEEEDLFSVTSLNNKNQILDKQTKQTIHKEPISNCKLETMNTEDENIIMQNEITSDTKMLISNNKQESQLEHQMKLTEDKPNMKHENVLVDSLASLYNNVWTNNTDPIDKENEQGFIVVSRKKHRNKSKITTPKVERTTVLKTLAFYTKARGLQ
ncbi:10662_t:CDS:2 [Cetraspora pellucida]|uniref:10662_t:CDS:1 n=1 Tax=Cetraspora pellucida TaxID=1433469 RepID=A0A9N9EBD3_9GLOM|nr:10662_t:CDS:2 [Cetraspora pellucida]